MGRHRTALGEDYRVERRLPRVAWRPRWRGPRDVAGWIELGGIGGGDGPLAIIGAVLFVIAMLVIFVPVLLLVAEVALVLALILPLMAASLALGLVRHTVLLRRGTEDGAPVVARREARGVVASWRAARELRAQADAGVWRDAPALTDEPAASAAPAAAEAG